VDEKGRRKIPKSLREKEIISNDQDFDRTPVKRIFFKGDVKTHMHTFSSSL